MAVTFQFKRGSESKWIADNPVLAEGELGLAIDVSKFKIGDGAKSWNQINYATGAGGSVDWSVSTNTGSAINISTGTGVNTLYYGNFLTTAQTPGAYLTTAAQSVHTHDYQSTGAYLTTQSDHTQFVGLISTGLTGGSWTINSSQLSLNIPSGSLYFSDLNGVTFGGTVSSLSTTITASVKTDYAYSGFTTTATAGTEFKGTLDTSGLKVAVPAFITTAAPTNHTHSDLYQSTGAYLTTAAGVSHTHGSNISTATTAGSELQMSSSSNGLTLGVPKWLTTAAGGPGGAKDWAISTVSGSDILITTGAATNTLYQPKYLTTAGTGGGAGDWATATTSGSGIDIVTGAATNTLKYGNFLTTAQAPGNYLTTAAQVSHDHGSINISATSNSTETAMRFTSNSSGWTIVQPSFLTTAMASNESHYSASSQLTATFAQTANVMLTGERGNYFYTSNNTFANSTHAHGNFSISATSNSTETAIRITSNSSGFTFVQPSFITTAMASDAGSNFIAVANSTKSVGLNTSSSSTGGADLKFSLNSSGATFSVPAWLTTTPAQTTPTQFVGLASTGITGGSATINSSQLYVNVPIGTVYFSDSNSFSFGSSTNGVSTTITASFNPSSIVMSDAGGITWSSSTSGSTTSMYVGSMAGGGGVAVQGSDSVWTDGTVSLSGSTNLTVNTSAGKILFSVADAIPLSNSTKFVQAWELEGANTAGTTSSLQGSVLYLSGGNNITLSGNSNTVIVSAGAGGGGVAVAGSAASTVTSGTMQFANSNGFSFGLNGSTMTLSGAYAGTGTSITGNASITHGTAGIAFNGTGLAGTNTAVTGSIALTVNSSGVSINASSLAGTATTIATTNGTDYKITLNSAGLNFAAPYGYMFFGNSNGHSWTSSTNGVSTTFYIVT
jgi:hypothetical protein